MVDSALVAAILRQYVLSWNGLHGVAHWARVLENGLRLTDATGANRQVVMLFAVFHDAGRICEGTDPDHGKRGAELALSLRGKFFDLPDADFALLYTACRDHSLGFLEAEVTCQTCWDADRLDLGRLGIRTRMSRLCTPEAKEATLVDWASARAREMKRPELILDWWGINLNSATLVE